MNEVKVKSWSIHAPWSDSLFIILTPFISFLFVVLICEPRSLNGAYLYGKETPIWFSIAATMLTHMHVLLVFVRSHMNKTIFKKFKYRFTLIPLAVLALMWVLPPFFLLLSVTALYWDEWHSVMQTFGFGRIYDAKVGADPAKGRKLDMGLCFVLGLLPHLVLFTYLPQDQKTEGYLKYLELSQSFIDSYGHFIPKLRLPLILSGVLYLFYYIFSYSKLIRNGYQYSKPKMALFAVTGLSTILTARFYTVADGIFFGNIYHALQYVFIVLISERENLKQITGLKHKSYNGVTWIYFLVIVPFVIVFAGLRQMTSEIPYLAAFWLLTSLLHFWFDGFIWSVRRQDI